MEEAGRRCRRRARSRLMDGEMKWRNVESVGVREEDEEEEDRVRKTKMIGCDQPRR